MASWLISRSVAARALVLAVAAGLVVLGVLQSREAKTDALPEFSPPYVEVQTEALGLSAEEVEQLITAPMENLLLNGVAFLDGIRSESVNGLSSITLIFEPGTDLLEARQVVQERLTQQGLLAHLTEPPVIVQPLSSSSRVLVVGFRSEDVSPIEMSVLARWTIRPRLLGVPGVANVSIFGQRERQLQVQVDPQRLARRGVTLQQVINTSGNALWASPLTYLNASAPGTGGFVDTPSSRLEIRHVSPIVAAEDLRQVALEPRPGSSQPPGMTLGDVARVTEDHQPLIGDAVVDDGPGLVMVVEKFPGANTLEVTEGIEAALDTLQPGLQGISVDTSLFRQATYVDQARDNYALTLGLGLLLALVLIVLFLMQVRATLIAVVSTVVSLSTAVVVLDLLSMGLDSMVLAGLALATTLVVVEAVVDVEHVVRRLRESPGPDAARVSVIEAALEMRRAMGFATAIVLVSLVPLLVLDPLSVALYRPALVAFAVAMLTSMAVALTVTPALCSVLLRGGTSTEPRGSRWLERTVAKLSRRSVPAVRPALAVLTLGVVAGALILPFLHASDQPGSLPRFKESHLVVAWRGDPGISRTGMTAIASELGAELRAVPGVKNVGGHVGRAVLSDRVNGIGAGELWVEIDPGADYAETVADVRAVAEGYDGATAEVRSYYSDRLEAVGALISDTDRGRVAAQDDEVVVRIYGEELSVLTEQAEAIQSTVSAIGDVDDVRVELPPVEPNLEVKVDLAAARLHGLKPGDIRRAATTLANGLKVGSLFEEQKVFDVIVNGRRDYFEDPGRIGELLIDTPDGGTVSLDEVADVEQGDVVLGDQPGVRLAPPGPGGDRVRGPGRRGGADRGRRGRGRLPPGVPRRGHPGLPARRRPGSSPAVRRVRADRRGPAAPGRHAELEDDRGCAGCHGVLDGRRPRRCGAGWRRDDDRRRAGLRRGARARGAQPPRPGQPLPGLARGPEPSLRHRPRDPRFGRTRRARRAVGRCCRSGAPAGRDRRFTARARDHPSDGARGRRRCGHGDVGATAAVPCALPAMG